MMSEQERVVEQLWYTWSDVGLDTIRAGFRIRAASPGLQDIRSVRVQSLDRYQRYSLPQDVNLAIAPVTAPLCLALINTGQERILLQKMYVGRDAIGRYGSFFVHLLAGLEGFSAKDAILLWRSPFWQYSDVSLKEDRYRTSLTTVSRTHLEQLATMRGTLPRTKEDSMKIRQYLPYIIQAYLTKKPLQEQATAQAVPQKLYIAASADDIAQLICGLTRCLPEAFLQNLTFSTYEPDVAEATTEIVGTCWLSIPDAEQDPHVAHLLPEKYYAEKLVLNCYTGRYSALENNPLVENEPSAAEFAQDATEYLLQGGEEFKEVLDALKDCRDRATMLRLYQSLSVQEPTEQNIAFALTPVSPSDYVNAAKMLSRQGYQRGIISLITYRSGWWQSFCRPAISNLRDYSSGIPMLAQALSRIAGQAMRNAVQAAREDMLQARDVTTATTTRGVETFALMIDVMQCTTSPEADAEIWLVLLQELAKIKDISVFFNTQRKVYALLMRTWCNLLPFTPEHSKLLQPFLPLTWATFGAFLALDLPLDWTEGTTKALLSRKSAALTQEETYALHQQYHRPIEDFLQQLSKDPQSWPIAEVLFKRLTDGHYPGKMALLFILVSSVVGEYPEYVKKLLAIAHLTGDEQVQFLMTYGPAYLAVLTGKTPIILNMFKDLAKYDAAKKMHVLFSWLDSAQLSSWFGSPPAGESNLAMILDKAYLTAQESGEFLQRYAKRYIPLYPQSPTFLNLFSTYAGSVREDRRTLMSILSTWLHAPLDVETLERLLQTARLTPAEQVNFLTLYGTHYVAIYSRSRILTQYLQEFYTYLLTSDLKLFKNSPSLEDPSNVEQLLRVLCNIPSLTSTYDWCFWYTIGRFVRRPAILQEESQQVADSVNWLLRKYATQQQAQAHTKLLQLLASACLEEEDELPRLVDVLEGILAPTDLLLLLYEIAIYIGDNFRAKRYKQTLLVLCIDYLDASKTLLGRKDYQQVFTHIFLDALVRDIGPKMFKQLNVDMKWWTPGMAAVWQEYNAHGQSALCVPTPSPFERLELWRERAAAFTHMRTAVRGGNQRRIARVSIEYLTTLNGNAESVPASWWREIDEAVRALNMFNKTLWNQYEAQLRPPLVRSVMQGKRSSAQVAARRTFGSRRFSYWWRWRMAYSQMRQALGSRNIGKIVRVASDSMPILALSGKQVPETWWRQLDAAFDFFLACEAIVESADESRERAIIAAYQKIAQLVEAREPAPILTEHERRRVKFAVYSVARLEAQRLRDTHRQWLRAVSTQQLLGPPGGSRR